MTQVLFAFKHPDGEPLANAVFTIRLQRSGFVFEEDGVVVPETLSITTGADGTALVELQPSSTPYLMIMLETGTDDDECCDGGKAIRYKFYVPVSETVVRAQDLLLAPVPNSEPWDEEALLLITEAKISALASKDAAKISETNSKNSEVAAKASEDAAEADANRTFTARDAAQSYANDSLNWATISGQKQVIASAAAVQTANDAADVEAAKVLVDQHFDYIKPAYEDILVKYPVIVQKAADSNTSAANALASEQAADISEASALDARDAAEAYAVDVLTSAVRAETAATEAELDAQGVASAVNTLRDELAGDFGADQVFAKSRLANSVRIASGKLWDQMVSMLTFGAIGDKTYHPLSERFSSVAQAQLQYVGVPITSLTQSIDWAAAYSASISGAPEVYCPGVYVLTDSVPIKRAMKWFGAGYQNDVNLEWVLSSSTFLAYGTFTKQYTALGVTDGRNSGGVFFNNPSKRFDKDATYGLANYYTETADPKLFSACFYIGFGVAGVIFEDLLIAKNFNGMDGYKNKTKGWGDNIDVGVYMDNARYCTFRNVNIIGYWKLNGLLIRSGTLDVEPDYVNSGVYSGGEENKFYNCVFQGWKSVGLRAIDMYKCLAVTPTYVEISYTASHPFKNHMRLRSQEFTGIFCTLSSVEQVGDRLRLYTVGDMTGKYFVGDPLLPSYHGNGVAGSVFHHCRMHGMWHTSGYVCSDTWHDEPLEPSACVEISGARIRGQRFEGTKFQTVDDIAVHAHQTIDLMLTPNARFEGSTDARGLAGVRMLSTNIAFEHYCRETYRVQMQCEQDGADFRPHPTANVPSKFAAEVPGNFWNPTLFGLYAEHGIYIGARNENNKLKLFYQGGYTVPLSATDGDYAASGTVREGTAQRVGDNVNITMSFYAGTGTFTTGNGQFQTTLPYASTHAVTIFHPMMLLGNAPANGKSVFLQIDPGSAVAKFVYWGPAGAAQPLLVKDVAVSGQPVRMSGSFTYKVKV